MATALRTYATLDETVDLLGDIKARIADLQEREAELRQTLVDSGVSEAEGNLFRATVSQGTVSRVDYKAVVGELEQTAQLKCRITKHTTESERTTVKVTSR